MLRRRMLYGKDLKFNQLVNINDYPNTYTYNGVTYTKNADNTFTANGTAVGNSFSFLQNNVLTQGLHYYYLADLNNNNNKITLQNNYYAPNSLAISDIKTSIQRVLQETVVGNIGSYRIRISSGTTVSNLNYMLMIIDLTAMYGVGNEPTDVATVKADCLALGHDLSVYQPYTPIS